MLLVVVTCLAAVTSSWNAVRFGQLNIVDILLLTAMVIAGITLVARKTTLHLKIWMFLPAAGALLFLVRDVVLLGRPLGRSAELLALGTGASPFLIFARITIATIVLFVILATVNATHQARYVKGILGWWVTGIVLSAGFSILQSRGMAPTSIDLVQTVNSVRFAGLTAHPNSLAQSVSLAIPVLIYYISAAKRSGRLLALAGTAVSVSALYASGSRAGLLVGFGVILLTVVLLIGKSRFSAFVVPFVLLGLAAILIYGNLLVAGTRLSGVGAADSDAGRLQSLAFGISLFQESPFFGVGLGSWVGEAVPLIVLSSGGLLFIPLYYAFLIAPIARFWKLRTDPFYGSLLVSTVGLFVFGFLNNGFAERYIFWPIIVGAVLASGRWKQGGALSRTDIRPF